MRKSVAMIIAPMLLAHPSFESQRWFVALVTFALAALAAGSAAFWVLHWPTPAAPVTATPLSASSAVVDSAKVAQLLGASANAPSLIAPAPSRYKLLGVIAQGDTASKGVRGSALIAVDAAPAKPYRVGETVADALVLQSVEQRRAVLAPADGAGAGVTLELPLPAGMTTPP